MVGGGLHRQPPRRSRPLIRSPPLPAQSERAHTPGGWDGDSEVLVNADAPAFSRYRIGAGRAAAVWSGNGGCGAEANQVDHVLPRHAGGVDVISNLVACCRACNWGAGGTVFASCEETRAWILAHRDRSRLFHASPWGIRKDCLGRS
jgi:hypothetical protein